MKARVLALLILAAFLFGCGSPVPPEKSSYVGEWRDPAMYLLITQDGSVSYKRLKGGVTTSINAPLKRFDGDNFEVGIGAMSTTFTVTTPPYQDETEQWKMVVDGVTLTRSH